MNTDNDRLMTQADVMKTYKLSEYKVHRLFMEPNFPSFLIGIKLHVWESDMKAYFKGQIKTLKAKKGGE